MLHYCWENLLVFWASFWRFVLVLSVLVNMAGCGTYRMAGLSGDQGIEPAVLESPFSVMYSPYFVTHIDCRSRGVGLYKRFEMIPGWRAITFKGNSQMGVPPNPKTFVFMARPGTVYTFEPDWNDHSKDWVLDILNQETGDSILHYWQRTEWSYWHGTTPDENLCELIVELNAS